MGLNSFQHPPRIKVQHNAIWGQTSSGEHGHTPHGHGPTNVCVCARVSLGLVMTAVTLDLYAACVCAHIFPAFLRYTHSGVASEHALAFLLRQLVKRAQ